ncbi:hypothetical protein I79_001747 [Cricetulus griseus]|uniref:Uncharacterized protein n=1 Tax=Cricetulus griseus TaxID=10029 RepID=G3GVK8_CRIGR|nr:hypothetical protein I79_001747 [Cricetulus griseus]
MKVHTFYPSTGGSLCIPARLVYTVSQPMLHSETLKKQKQAGHGGIIQQSRWISVSLRPDWSI